MDSNIVRLCGREIDRPGHICAFFDSAEQEHATLIPYFRDGIDAGEQVLNIVDDDLIFAQTTRVADAGLPLGYHGVSILGARQTYLEGGRFEMQRMADFIRDRLAVAREEGKRVRVTGLMSWIRHRAPGTERLVEYEARANFLVPTFDCTLMCVYNMEHLDGKTIVDVMSAHPYVILNGQIRENSSYVPPEQYLARLREPGAS